MLLNLSSITVVKTVENGEHDYHVYANVNAEPTECQECGNGALYGHGAKEQLFMDTPIHGRRVGIFLTRKRYRCRQCKTTIFQPCDHIDDNHRATKRLVNYIEKTAIIKTCVSVAHEVGLSEGLIRSILKDYTAMLDKKYTFETPEILGIDEVHLKREMRLVLTNIGKKTIVDMHDNRSKKTVINALYRFKNLSDIKIVTMDMWRQYKEAVYAVLPHAYVIIDKFHIVKMANEAVEKGRKELRAQLSKEEALQLKRDRWLLLKRKRDLKPIDIALLSGWVDNYPELYDLHLVKEAFFDIWDQPYTRSQAVEAYNVWVDSIPSSVSKYFDPIVATVGNWHKEIFNYFDFRFTNAYTESANNHIKAIAKQGRGYSFDVLRARVLFVGAKHKIRPKSLKSGVADRMLGWSSKDDLFFVDAFVNYGAEFLHDPDNL